MYARHVAVPCCFDRLVTAGCLPVCLFVCLFVQLEELPFRSPVLPAHTAVLFGPLSPLAVGNAAEAIALGWAIVAAVCSDKELPATSYSFKDSDFRRVFTKVMQSEWLSCASLTSLAVPSTAVSRLRHYVLDARSAFVLVCSTSSLTKFPVACRTQRCTLTCHRITSRRSWQWLSGCSPATHHSLATLLTRGTPLR